MKGFRKVVTFKTNLLLQRAELGSQSPHPVAPFLSLWPGPSPGSGGPLHCLKTVTPVASEGWGNSERVVQEADSLQMS